MASDDPRVPVGYYDALERCAWRVEPRGFVAVGGRDAVSFLHNIVTNDIESLLPGVARYAAYLTPQGRMIADMDVLRREDDLLLAVEPDVAADLAERLDRSLFTEDVRIEDRSDRMRSLAVYGPDAAAAVAGAIDAAPARVEGLVADSHMDAGNVTVLRDDRLGTPGWHAIGAPDACERIAARLQSSGVPSLAGDAFTVLRIEAGIPLFGVDMTATTIPLEAGIENRAISMTKGCYVGQEVIVRILHRGHGRVAKRLVGLLLDGPDVPPRESPLFAEGTNVGAITSAAWSPRLGRPVAIGYVSREAAVPGNSVYVGAPGGVAAQIAAFPLT